MRCARRQGRAAGRGFVFEPFRQAAGIVADVRVAEVEEQADGLRTERSRRAAAVGDDGRSTIRKQRVALPRQVDDRHVDRARDVHGGERFRRQHVDQRDAARSQRLNELVARNFRRAGARGR